jgi:hypothetical protein
MLSQPENVISIAEWVTILILESFNMFKKPTGSSCKAINSVLVAAALTQIANRGLVTKASSHLPLWF